MRIECCRRRKTTEEFELEVRVCKGEGQIDGCVHSLEVERLAGAGWTGRRICVELSRLVAKVARPRLRSCTRIVEHVVDKERDFMLILRGIIKFYWHCSLIGSLEFNLSQPSHKRGIIIIRRGWG